jgi:hypothetical protein
MHEMIYGKPPRLGKMFPFGCICFTHISLESRSNARKLEQSGVKCRLIGYGDDSGVHEQQGYKLLKENDYSAFYSVNVLFKISMPMAPISIPENHIHEIQEDLWSPPSTEYHEIDQAIDRGHVVTRRGTQAIESDLESLESEDEFEDESDYVPTSTEDESTSEQAPNPFAALAGLPLSSVNDPEFYRCLNAAMTDGCPKTYEEAINVPSSEQWKKAMDEEMQSINNAKTWVVKCGFCEEIRQRWYCNEIQSSSSRERFYSTA